MADEVVLRKYFLGLLPSEERADLERAFFADETLFEDLISTENDLIDAYVRDGLPAAEKVHFEQQYRSSPERWARVEVARALCAVSIGNEEPPPLQQSAPWRLLPEFAQLRWPIIGWALAAGLLVTIAATSWLSLQDRRLRHESAKANNERATLEKQQIEARERQAHAPGDERLAGPPSSRDKTVRSHLATAILTLTPGTSRSEDSHAAELVLSSDTARVRLQLTLKDDDYSSYSAILQDPDGNEVSRETGLHSRSIGSAKAVDWNLASRLLTSESYIVRLYGTAADGNLEEVSSYSFGVIRR